jgi:hypothetical protein
MMRLSELPDGRSAARAERIMTTTLVCSLALVLATPLPAEVYERDHERICGDWKLDDTLFVTIRSDGTFRGRQVIISPDGGWTPPPDTFSGRYMLNPASKSGWVEIGVSKVKGVYRLDGNQLELLLYEEGKERPKFSDPAKRANILRFKRVRKGAAP